MATREDILINVINKVQGLEKLDKQTKVLSRLGKQTNALSRAYSKQTEQGKVVTNVSASIGEKGAKVSRITETLTKKTDAQIKKDRLLSAQQKFRGVWSDKLGKNTAEVNKIMGSQGITVDENGKAWDLAGRSIKDVDKEMRIGAANAGRFKMEYLGVMFGGMALNRAMTNLNATSREWVGINDLMSTAMGVVTLPATLDLLNFGVLPLFDALTNLPEGAKIAIGYTTSALGGLGSVMETGGQLMLGIASTVLMLEKIGGGTVLGGIAKLRGRLGGIAKFAAAGIFITIAFNDLKEGEVIAAIGGAMAAAGILVGGKGGVALMAVGITLQLAGDEDFLVSVLKTFYKIGIALKSIIKESLLSAFTFRDFNVDNIQGLGNIKRAFGRAIEEIQQQEAGKGVFDVIEYPKNMLDKINEDMNGLKDLLKNDLITREEYVVKLDTLTSKQENILKRWGVAYNKNKEANKSGREKPKNFTLGFGLGPRGFGFNLNQVNSPQNGKSIGDGVIGPNGKLITTNPRDYLIATKDPQSLSSGVTLNVTYNVNVSDKKEMEVMLRRNNQQLTSEVRRIVNV